MRATWPLKTGKLSEAEKEQIAEMGEAGKPTQLIARKLGRTPSTVHYHLVLAGVKKPVERQFSHRRGGHEVRSFSPEEDRYIEEQRQAGKNPTQIGRMLGERFGYPRASNTVAIRLVQIANRAEA